MNVVPVKIRKHLIPFFYKEFEGTEAVYLNKRVKACKINDKSSLGFMLLTAIKKTDLPVRPSKYYVYITYENDFNSKMYTVERGKNCWLKVPEEMNERINNILEDQFRIAFVFMVKGMLVANPSLKVRDAIAHFMTEYEMDEFDFSLESMRRLLNRGSEIKLKRLQSKISNRVLNYGL
jgi:hypothetical protein